MSDEESITLADIEHETMRKLSWGKDAAIRGINRREFRIEFENESEESVDVVIRPRGEGER